MTNDDVWEWFKELVYEMRDLNNEIMKTQNGIFVEISLIDRSINNYISILPHAVNLTGKKCTVLREGKHELIDLKYLVINKTIRESEK